MNEKCEHVRTKPVPEVDQSTGLLTGGVHVECLDCCLVVYDGRKLK